MGLKNKKMARKSKLTAEVEEALLKMIEQGLTVKRACNALGISEKTFYSWIERGKTGKGKYAEFLDKVKKAEAKFIADAVEKIKEAGQKNWQALAWLLERKFPEEFGKKESLQVEGKMSIDVLREFFKEGKNSTKSGG
ncbi:MAG: transposase [Candidatus Thermoplasmatota archaeon]